MMPRLAASLRRGPHLPGRDRRALGATSIETIERFDDRSNELRSNVAPHYGVVSRRDAVSLQWRFDSAPDRARYGRYYLTRGNRVVGHLVLRETTWRSLRAHSIVDYFAAPTDIEALLTHARAISADAGAAALLCTTLNPAAGSALRRVGFTPRRSGSTHPLTVYLDDNTPLRTVLADAQQWFLTSADSDLD